MCKTSQIDLVSYFTLGRLNDVHLDEIIDGINNRYMRDEQQSNANTLYIVLAKHSAKILRSILPIAFIAEILYIFVEF